MSEGRGWESSLSLSLDAAAPIMCMISRATGSRRVDIMDNFTIDPSVQQHLNASNFEVHLFVLARTPTS